MKQENALLPISVTKDKVTIDGKDIGGVSSLNYSEGEGLPGKLSLVVYQLDREVEIHLEAFVSISKIELPLYVKELLVSTVLRICIALSSSGKQNLALKLAGLLRNRFVEWGWLEDSPENTKEAESSLAWGIRDKTTGGFLPARRAGRGFSHDHPTIGVLPRLFASKHAARLALSAWLRGTWDDFVFDKNEWNGQDYKVGAKPRKVSNRHPENMEIVEVTLTW